MSEHIDEPAGPPADADPWTPVGVSSTAERIEEYAVRPEAASPEPAEAPAELPTQQPQEWSIDDPWVQDLVQERAGEMARQMLQAEGVLEYEPGEIELMFDEFDRADRVERFESALQTRDQLVEMVNGWQGELGAQVDPNRVIDLAEAAFDQVANVGYRLTGEQALEMVRTAAREVAALGKAEQSIGDQIAREAQVRGLFDRERGAVRELAESKLAAIAERRGAFDAAAAREAVSEATREVASRPGRVVESSRERVFRVARAAEEQRNAGPSAAAQRAAFVQQRNDELVRMRGGR